MEIIAYMHTDICTKIFMAALLGIYKTFFATQMSVNKKITF